MSTIEDKIISTIEKIRPFIQRDGGDVEFDSFEDGIVYVRMLGACEGCAMVNDTIEAGIGILLKEEVEGVIDVRLASTKNEVSGFDDFRFENKE